mgnify:CR=1 FL=1
MISFYTWVFLDNIVYGIMSILNLASTFKYFKMKLPDCYYYQLASCSMSIILRCVIKGEFLIYMPKLAWYFLTLYVTVNTYNIGSFCKQSWSYECSKIHVSIKYFIKYMKYPWSSFIY